MKIQVLKVLHIVKQIRLNYKNINIVKKIVLQFINNEKDDIDYLGVLLSFIISTSLISRSNKIYFISIFAKIGLTIKHIKNDIINSRILSNVKESKEKHIFFYSHNLILNENYIPNLNSEYSETHIDNNRFTNVFNYSKNEDMTYNDAITFSSIMQNIINKDKWIKYNGKGEKLVCFNNYDILSRGKQNYSINRIYNMIIPFNYMLNNADDYISNKFTFHCLKYYICAKDKMVLSELLKYIILPQKIFTYIRTKCSSFLIDLIDVTKNLTIELLDIHKNTENKTDIINGYNTLIKAINLGHTVKINTIPVDFYKYLTPEQLVIVINYMFNSSSLFTRIKPNLFKAIGTHQKSIVTLYIEYYNNVIKTYDHNNLSYSFYITHYTYRLYVRDCIRYGYLDFIKELHKLQINNYYKNATYIAILRQNCYKGWDEFGYISENKLVVLLLLEIIDARTLNLPQKKLVKKLIGYVENNVTKDLIIVNNSSLKVFI